MAKFWLERFRVQQFAYFVGYWIISLFLCNSWKSVPYALEWTPLNIRCKLRVIDESHRYWRLYWVAVRSCLVVSNAPICYWFLSSWFMSTFRQNGQQKFSDKMVYRHFYITNMWCVCPAVIFCKTLGDWTFTWCAESSKYGIMRSC